MEIGAPPGRMEAEWMNEKHFIHLRTKVDENVSYPI
jgi:hypothetical protein